LFERFNDQARRIVVLAQQEARRLDHNYIGTEHLLLGMLAEGKGVAAVALRGLGMSLEPTRSQVEAEVGRGKQSGSGHIPFTPPAKKALELALRESVTLDQPYVGTWALLLGLTQEEQSPATKILERNDASMAKVRAQVLQVLRDDPDLERGPAVPVRRATRLQLSPEAWHSLLPQVEIIEARLAAIEAHLGIATEAAEELSRTDEQIAAVRRQKEVAIDEQDFPTAAALRAQEKELLATRSRLAAEGRSPRPSAANAPAADASEVARLRTEIERLTALLREHDIDP
jgi:Clp amino terminal domain, pathogenicity island component